MNKDIHKHLTWLFSFSREPVYVKVGDSGSQFGGYRAFEISSTFWRSIKCECCGHCCLNYTLVWDAIHKPKGSKEIKIKVNDKPFSLFYLPEVNGNDRCQWLSKDNKCLHYMERPILSRLPHMNFNVWEGILYLGKKQFGRNWRLGCNAKVKPFDYKELQEVDVPVLERLLEAQKSYGIKSELEWMVEKLKGYPNINRWL